MIATLDEVMDAAAAAITGAPITGGAISGAEISEAGPVGPVTGALKVGVDLGTAYTVVVALDEEDRPLAGASAYADVVRDGVVVDFLGALDLLTRLKARVEARLGRALTSAHGAYPPGIPEDDARAVRHVIEAAGMECSGLVDEPSAANAVLGLRDGVVVDVGGGTTGIAVVRDGTIVHTADEPTGGHHLSLVIAGALGVDLEAAEALKRKPAEQARLFPIVRPVLEKVATIIERNVPEWPGGAIHLVGGTVAFPHFAEVVAEITGRQAVVPAHPLYVTPLGIARCATPAERTP
ncbi:MAG: ethanolamine utilization protein EutJ [Dermatophilaceae bacterium]